MPVIPFSFFFHFALRISTLKSNSTDSECSTQTQILGQKLKTRTKLQDRIAFCEKQKILIQINSETFNIDPNKVCFNLNIEKVKPNYAIRDLTFHTCKFEFHI